MFNDFKRFIMRGSVVDLAIGFTVGAAFTTVVKSLVNDIIMPPAGLAVGSVQFKDLFWVLRPGDPEGPYTTLASAQAAGAVSINYGVFVNSVVALLLVGLAMFAIVRTVSRLDKALDEAIGDKDLEPEEPPQKKCPYCREQIAFRAVRCPKCTSRLEGFEEQAAATAGPTTTAG